MQDKQAKEVYASAWSNLRRRKWTFYLGFFGIPVLGLLKYFIDQVFSVSSVIVSTADNPAWVLVYIFLWIASGLYLVAFRCPQCRNLFFSSRHSITFLQHTCTHCGIHEGQLIGDDKIVIQAVPFYKRTIVIIVFVLVAMYLYDHFGYFLTFWRKI